MKTITMPLDEYEAEIKLAEKRGLERGYPHGYNQARVVSAEEFLKFVCAELARPYAAELEELFKLFSAQTVAVKVPRNLK